VATNTTVLILVTAMAALVLTGALALVVYKTRNQQRHGKGETIRDQSDENAQVEVDNKTVHRSEAVTSRDQLNELRDQAAKLTADSPST
jgi:hypothetical protein